MTIRTKFDGRGILLPKELEGHAPCDVEIVLVDDAANGARHASIWDAVAQSRGVLDSSVILHEASAERDNWGHA
jgi:hypothetical protein